MASTQSKERILSAAKELFLARGYAATTVDAICEKAELTKGSVYYFFDSKEDLGLAVLAWSIGREPLPGSPEEAWRGLAVYLVRQMRTCKQLSKR